MPRPIAARSSTGMSTSGKGRSGWIRFAALLREPKFSHAAFIAETPVDAPGDEERNVLTLRGLAGSLVSR